LNTVRIEDTILETGLVVEAFVIGYPDKLLGHKLIAAADAKEAQISECCSCFVRTVSAAV
jgi:hypothetical protein